MTKHANTLSDFQIQERREKINFILSMLGPVCTLLTILLFFRWISGGFLGGNSDDGLFWAFLVFLIAGLIDGIALFARGERGVGGALIVLHGGVVFLGLMAISGAFRGTLHF